MRQFRDTQHYIEGSYPAVNSGFTFGNVRWACCYRFVAWPKVWSTLAPRVPRL